MVKRRRQCQNNTTLTPFFSPMLELDHVWSKMLDEAAVNASKDGRHAAAEYLRLRATNDAIRRAGVNWLFDTMIEIAATQPRLTIEREEPHNFAVGNSNMAGSYLEIRLGVRCLMLEAGWARTPKDGIMRNGALAFARITHFGMPTSGAEIRLVHGETLPHWLSGDDTTVDSQELRRHFDIFLSAGF